MSRFAIPYAFDGRSTFGSIHLLELWIVRPISVWSGSLVLLKGSYTLQSVLLFYFSSQNFHHTLTLNSYDTVSFDPNFAVYWDMHSLESMVNWLLLRVCPLVKLHRIVSHF